MIFHVKTGISYELRWTGLRGERERNLVTHVHRSTGRTASGIKVERLAFLVSVENDVEIPDDERLE